jgi:hypothetical protein
MNDCVHSLRSPAFDARPRLHSSRRNRIASSVPSRHNRLNLLILSD